MSKTYAPCGRRPASTRCCYPATRNIAHLAKEFGENEWVAVWLAMAGVVLTLCQLAVGEYQYRNGLPWGVIAVHVAIAATLVVTVVNGTTSESEAVTLTETE